MKPKCGFSVNIYITSKAMKQEITDLLTSLLSSKGFVFGVSEHKNVFSGNYLKIWVACSEININDVSGQKPQLISLNLDIEPLELTVQIFGGNGGQNIYRKPNLNHPEEQYLAMKGIKIPFRKPAPNKESVLKAIEKFVKCYIEKLKENKEVLEYKNIVNYDILLS